MPAPSPREAFVLHRVGTDDPSIRLACQLKPTDDLSFFQLFLPHTVSTDGHAGGPTRIGQERYLVSMFVDIRGSTKMAEKRLPFDTVFIVNRFLGAVSQAVIEAGAIVSETDARGRITAVNDRFCKISGYAREELVGRVLLRSLLTPQSRRIFDEHFARELDERTQEKPEGKPEEKPEEKPAGKPAEPVKPEVKPVEKPVEPVKPEEKPDEKPVEPVLPPAQPVRQTPPPAAPARTAPPVRSGGSTTTANRNSNPSSAAMQKLKLLRLKIRKRRSVRKLLPRKLRLRNSPPRKLLLPKLLRPRPKHLLKSRLRKRLLPRAKPRKLRLPR